MSNQIIRLSTIVVLSAIILTFATFATYPGPNGTKNNNTQYSYGELSNNTNNSSSNDNNSTQQPPIYNPPYFPPSY